MLKKTTENFRNNLINAIINADNIREKQEKNVKI